MSSVAGKAGQQANQILHVLTLTPFYPTRDDDANGCFVAEPLPALAEIGVRNTVLVAQPFYRGGNTTHPSAPLADAIRYFSVPGGIGLAGAGAFLFARILGRLRKLHFSQKIDIIHAHGPLPCGHAAMLLSRELGIPYVVSVHGLDAYATEQVHGRPGLWCRRVSARVFQNAEDVICISEHVRERVLEGAVQARTSVVYNGVDPNFFSPEQNTDSPHGPIVSIGNLISIKGHDVLLKAVATARKTHPDMRLDIVGNGSERGRLEALARDLGLADCVRFLGRVPRREAALVLRDCTLFALASHYEGLGCVYLEAMSAAKVAIGCRGQGIEEVIRHGENGWLIDANNVEQLASSLTTLWSDPALRQAIGGRARQTILNGFTLGYQAERLLDVYRKSVS